MVSIFTPPKPDPRNQEIADQQKLLVEEAKRRRAAALADYERRHSPAPASIDSQFANVFSDTPSQAADTACSVSDSSGSCGGGE